MKLGEFMLWIWFVSFLILLVIELATVNLVTIWFAIGSLIAMLVSALTDSVFLQVLAFIITSIIALIFTKPIMKKVKGFEKIPTNSDRVIGKKGEVTKKIESDKYGEVKVFGNTWTATSDKTIEVGKKVIVTGIEGVKLIVKKEEE